MNFTLPMRAAFCALAFSMVMSATNTGAQNNRRPPVVISPEVSDTREVTFRVRAPEAAKVRIAGSGDLPRAGNGQSAEMSRGEDGVWFISMGPLAPGAYRYAFEIDGVRILDPVNTDSSRSNDNLWSLVHIPGEKWMDTVDVPHGAVSEITYWSSKLDRFRHLHVYTPPGYESSTGDYPVLYLLHGAFDSDDSWSTVGRAGFILDSLIAEGKAVPMIVVMPHGHTGPFAFGGGSMSGEFEPEFVADIMPLMEKRYRVIGDRAHRAIAGLSMGGAHTLNIGVPNLEKFGYMGVFSSGIFGINGGGPGGNRRQGPSFAEQHTKILNDASLKEGLELFWFATGKDDFLVETSRATVKMFRGHGFDVVYKETEGAHTWDKWREYLHEFAQMLFKSE